MLVEKINFDTKAFVREFTKKFKNFADKCPLFIQYKIINNSILIYLNENEEPILYEIDFSLSEKENIRKIKTSLEKFYPTFEVFNTTEQSLSLIELNTLLNSQKLSLNEALSTKKKNVTSVSYRIEKILNKYNRLVLRNSDGLILQQFTIPVMTFLKAATSKDLSVESLFKEKSFLVKNLKESTS